MNELEERLFDDLGKCFTTKPYILMGDADWYELAKGLKTQAVYKPSAEKTKMDCLRFAGAVIYSNGMAMTRGWIIGSEEDIMRMRNAVWAAQYIHMFSGTVDGMVALYGKLMD